jgi:Ca2+-transporting ATPase
VHVFECKSERKQLFDIPVFNNILLVLAVLCSITMLLIVIYIPVLNNIFKTVALSMNEWVIILGFSALGPAISGLLGINVKK